MTLFYVNLAAVYLSSFFARYFSKQNEGGSSVVSPNKLLAFLGLTSLVLLSGLRSDVGDTFFYKHSYKVTTFTWEKVMEGKDKGFAVLQLLLQKVSEDPQILIFTTALITNVLFVLILYKYARMFELGLYVYITGGLFLVSMNGIRQAFASAVLFMATKFLIEGNWKSYMLVVLLASTFHQSALILIPIYFVVRVKAWSKATAAVVLLAVFVVVGFDQFSSMLFSTIEDTQYGHYSNFSEGGANFMRVAVEAVPLGIAFLGREKLRELFPKSDVIVNMTLLGFIFMLISTQNWIFARFSIYFWPFQLILISWIPKLFREKDEKLVYYGIVICYFIYYYFENVISLNMVYRSDYLIW
ncbi:EpsG family protein [Domibacillus sp.]|uniref:EpsG family protein n=1 Tax=Domibacillus sp. TaxID=1969783 RepID=UPI002811A278|nr:EpsG family protein [Domibacillus sp.]